MDDICREILCKAELCAGAQLSEGSQELLLEMCAAAHAELLSRLKEGTRLEEIRERYVMAAGILAVSMLVGLEPTRVSGFTAGSVSMKQRSEKEIRDSAGALRAQAETMLWDCLKQSGFSFRTVRA